VKTAEESFPFLSPRLREALRIAAFTVLYYLAHYIAFSFPGTDNVLMAVWPAGGIGLAALLLTRRRLWPLVIALLFMVGTAADLSVGRPFFNSVGFMTANVLESLGCASLIILVCGQDIRFTKIREILALLFSAIFVNAATAFIGAGTAFFSTMAPFWDFWKTWWISDGLGIFLITPLIITWSRNSPPSAPPRWGRIIEEVLFFPVWCTVAWLTFRSHALKAPLEPQPYLLFALMAWPALRFGQRSVATAVVILAAFGLGSGGITAGPSLLGGSTYLERLFMFQLYLGTIAMTGYLLAASYFEAASEAQTAFEEKQRVTFLGDNLPRGMIYQVVREHDGRMHFLYVSAGVERMNGVSAEKVLRDPAALYGLIVEEDREAVARAEEESARSMTPFNVTARLRRPDGEVRWMQLSSSPRLLKDNRILWDGIETDITDRKRAEETLLYFQMAVSSATDAIGMSTPEGRHYYQNEAFTRLFGLSVSEVDGVSGPPATIYADEREGRKIFETLIEGGAFEGEVKMLDKDRREKDIFLRAYPIKDSKGKILGLVGIHTDITDRNRAEEETRRSERQLRESQEVARLGSWDLDLLTQELQWSDETYKLFDKKPKDFVPSFDGFARMVHPDDRGMMETHFNDALKSDDNPYHVVVRIINDSGREWVMEAFGSVRRDKSGEAVGILGTAQDITEKRQAEEVLRLKEEMMRNLLDGVDEGFIVVDRDYRIVSANRAYCQQTGLSSLSEVQGKYCYEISHRTDRPCFENGEECAPRLVFETGEPHVSIHRHPGQDEEMLYVETKAFPIKDSAGSVTSVIEVINNITEKQLIEEQRLKAQKLEAVGTLAGGIAHDFNNLLQGVFGYITMAKMSLDDKQTSIKMLEQAEKALQMSVNLTTQLLTFSKGGKPVSKKVDLRPVIENAVKFALSGSMINYGFNVDRALWQVEADEGQIGQVIQNIVLNAEQAMPLGGTVTISANNMRAPQKEKGALLDQRNYVEISVKDTGIGIPPEYLSKIFDPYFTTKEKGSGLGLATAYSIIRNHGGAIDVRSEPGRGSTFTFWLPAVEGGEEKVEVLPSLKESTVKHYKILVMDDEELLRNITGEMLKLLGHKAEFAARGEDAVAKYREALTSGRRFDIVLLDLTIRGGTGGVDTLKMLREIDPEVTAIVSSGYADSAAIAEYEALGFRACLTKPYSLEVLKETLNRLKPNP
jgi:two-component system cell cycle sensor histidine kinase/response regulator CckA